jgi:hypothetical protein
MEPPLLPKPEGTPPTEKQQRKAGLEAVIIQCFGEQSTLAACKALKDRGIQVNESTDVNHGADMIIVRVRYVVSCSPLSEIFVAACTAPAWSNLVVTGQLTLAGFKRKIGASKCFATLLSTPDAATN